MADMGLPALALRTDYIANSGGLDAFRQGRQDGIADEERNLLKKVGGIAATGNYLDASKAAMAGGNVKLGTDIANWDLERKSKAYEFLLNGVQRADTPEKYQTLVDMVTKNFGPDMVRGYETFDKRPSALTTLQQAEQALKQKLADSTMRAQAAQAALHEAQTIATLRKPTNVLDTLQALGLTHGQPGQTQQAPMGPQSSVGGASGGDLTSVPGTTVTPPTQSAVGIQPQQQSAVTTQPQVQETPADIVKRMSVGQRTALALLISKEDFAGAAKLFQDVASGKDASEAEDKLRKEHEGLIKDFREAQSGVMQLETAFSANNSIGDIAMVYALMKALDPGSVVRETEYGFVVNSQSIPQALVQRINQFWDGKRLTKDIRDQMVAYGRSALDKRSQEYESLTGQIQSIAKSRGADPSRSTLNARMDSRDAAIPRLGQFTSGAGAVAQSAQSMAQQQAAQPPPANAAQLLKEAREALDKGADRAKVIERLKSMNVDPKGL